MAEWSSQCWRLRKPWLMACEWHFMDIQTSSREHMTTPSTSDYFYPSASPMWESASSLGEVLLAPTSYLLLIWRVSQCTGVLGKEEKSYSSWQTSCLSISIISRLSWKTSIPVDSILGCSQKWRRACSEIFIEELKVLCAQCCKKDVQGMEAGSCTAGKERWGQAGRRLKFGWVN